jgi:NADH:ubiquinone oxidoreductase subunit E
MWHVLLDSEQTQRFPNKQTNDHEREYGMQVAGSQPLLPGVYNKTGEEKTDANATVRVRAAPRCCVACGRSSYVAVTHQVHVCALQRIVSVVFQRSECNRPAELQSSKEGPEKQDLMPQLVHVQKQHGFPGRF